MKRLLFAVVLSVLVSGPAWGDSFGFTSSFGDVSVSFFPTVGDVSVSMYGDHSVCIPPGATTEEIEKFVVAAAVAWKMKRK